MKIYDKPEAKKSHVTPAKPGAAQIRMVEQIPVMKTVTGRFTSSTPNFTEVDPTEKDDEK